MAIHPEELVAVQLQEARVGETLKLLLPPWASQEAPVGKIEKLQSEGYTWKIGAFHEYYLVPPGAWMGYPSFIGGTVFFIDNSEYPDEVADVMKELYGH